MKKTLWKLAGLFSLILLSGCNNMVNGPNDYQQQCWPTYYRTSSCGTCIFNRCEKYCANCTFSEPACQKCWQCISYDKCENSFCTATQTRSCGVQYKKLCTQHP